MTARHRTGLRLAAAETRDGANPELRTLAQQMTTELQRRSSGQPYVWSRSFAGRFLTAGPWMTWPS
jgi:hypothetical protein